MVRRDVPSSVQDGLALALGTASLAAFLLVVLHVQIWRAWQDRWPRQLRARCEALIRRESHG